MVDQNNRNTATSNGCIHYWFEEQVRAYGANTALVCGTAEISYAELNSRANRVAHLLRALKVTLDTPVGICIERGFDLISCLLGVLKSGGAYVPLEPAHPSSRLGFVLADTGAPILLTQRRLIDRLSGYDGLAICVDDPVWEAQFSEQSDANSVPLAQPGNLAYIIYTSGSTGRPKGVQVEHAGLVNYISWCQRVYAGSGVGGSPLFSSIAFDAVVPSLYTPLVSGQPIYLLPAHLELSRLGKSLKEAGRFSFIKLTPAHLDLLSKQLSPQVAAELASVWVVGGDSLLSDRLRYWQDHDTTSVMLNEYGPTEATVANAAYMISGPVTGPVVPIGKPIPNTTFYVLDDHLDPRPTGVSGELYIGGVCVARGYHNRPELTAERFVPDPFSSEPGRRLYRTGDLGRLLPDGNIEFLGRVDDQIKIRGYRIEPAEIETALLSHPDVADVHVNYAVTSGQERQLTAYVVAVDIDRIPSDGQLRTHLIHILPDYMLPQIYVILDALPLNANGKIDRAALPTPTAISASAHQQPATDLERQLIRIWKSVLNQDQIGAHDDFFDLGGHSLLAIQVINRIETDIGLDVPLWALFEYPTVNEFAQFMDSSSSLDHSR